MKKLLITGALGLTASIVSAQKQPNIVYIFTDQHTANALSCTGNPDVKTPNIDRLAQNGIRFTNAYCACPLSTPSRAAMFTGVTPGKLKQLVNGSSIPQEYIGKGLGNLIQAAGYECAYSGKWHIPESDIPDSIHGFKKLYGHNDYGLSESCIDFLKQKHDKPFFLVAAYDNPHNICEYARSQNLPFAEITEPNIEDCPNLPANFAIAPYDADVIRQEQENNYKGYPVTRYTPDDWRRYRNAYYRLVENVDSEIGKLLDALDQLKLSENTLIIFTSDHGDGVGAHHWNQKSALYEEVTNIPLIVKLPKNKNAGKITHQLINNGIDLLPTLCEFANADIPDYCLGKSFKPIVEKISDTPIHDYVVCETQFDNSTTKGWMVRTRNYKYIVYDKGKYREQLYDMNNDRGEMINLAVEEKYKNILDQHRKLLNEWHENNNVPKLKNATPKIK